MDEYDKPILDALHRPNLATANRDYLSGCYGIIKGCAEHIRFTFVTGVSMFSRVSLFSGLNILEDISLDPSYATVCGYTDADIDTVFTPELEGLNRDGIRTWYNGYGWRGDERVYNPYDVLLLFRKREFRPWWYGTGSPNFLFESLIERSVSPMELENRVTDTPLLSKFDVGDIGTEALLFQTGYLSTAEEMSEGIRTQYRLDYPNLEVRTSLNDGLLARLDGSGGKSPDDGRVLLALLRASDFDGFVERLRPYLAGIPYQWHARGDLVRCEAWYAGLLYMCLRCLGTDLRVEKASARGQADMAVHSGGRVFVLEFKVVEGESGAEAALDAAMRQMRERGYAERYRADGLPVHLLAVVCGRETRNLLQIRAKPA